jgi:hypothetical protein
MADFNVGPGVAQAIAANGAEARSDEVYVVMTDGQKVSRTFATDGVYYYYESDNRTQRTPF